MTSKAERCIRAVPMLSFLFVLGQRKSSRAAIAQLGERETEDLKVPGSIPGLGMSSLGPEEVKCLDFKGSTLYPRSADAIFSFCSWQKKIVMSRDSSAGRASD